MTPTSQSAPEPARLRKRLPARYSWIDHAAKGRLESCTSVSHALYLILLLISNRHGLSYHGDKSIQTLTKLDRWQLRTARQGLIDAGLIAYTRPMYQVLDLTAIPTPRSQPKTQRRQQSRGEDTALSEEERAAIIEKLRQFRRQLSNGRKA
jgi:hypothetical protein